MCGRGDLRSRRRIPFTTAWKGRSRATPAPASAVSGVRRRVPAAAGG